MRNQEFLSAATNGYLLATVTLGRRGTAMPPWGRGSSQHRQLAYGLMELMACNGNRGEAWDAALEAMEREHIIRVMREMDGNVPRSAKVLGIDRATLYNKIKKYGIQR